MRAHLERVLRAASVVLLAIMIWQSMPREPGRARIARADRGALDAALRAWTFDGPDSAHLHLDSVPARALRDWLVALRRTGTTLSWTSDALPAVALELLPVGDPRGLARVLVTGPRTARVVLRDRAGVLDTARVESLGAVVTAAIPPGGVRAAIGAHEAVAVAHDSVMPRRVLVIGAPGWETKFAIAALEEAGWRIDARLPVAPGVDVILGEPGRPDTARYAAVVLLDETSAPEIRAIPDYVRGGGGLVLAGTSARRQTLAPLAPAALGARRRAQTAALASSAPRGALAVYPLVRLRDGAMPLETRDDIVTAAAMRVGAGRVTQVGYEESWRWRFASDDGAPAEHRAWWSRVMASAAYRATASLSQGTAGESAPLAALHAALGPATRIAATGAMPRAGGLRWWMLAALFALLLGEWASRRARGAP
jgi:hypothetical protein